MKDTYRGSERNGRERERTAGKQSDISLKSSISLYKVIGYAEVKCSVLSLNKITPPISNLAASADSFNLPLCFSLFLSHRSPPLVLVKIARNMTEIRGFFSEGPGVELHRNRKEELYRSKCFNLFKNYHYHVTWTRPFCLCVWGL